MADKSANKRRYRTQNASCKMVWKSHKFLHLRNMEDFLAAMEETMYKNKDTRDDAPDWLQKVLDSYEKHYGVRLQIPRWSEIASKYVNR